MSAVVARSTRRPFLALMRSSLRWTIVVFALMASAAVMLVVLWQRSPLLSAVLVGPLLAIALYQRSTYHALRAMRLALTDPLTGLGNHRHFHDRLQRELARGGGERDALHALPARRRRLQADQRPVRPPGGRPAAGRARLEAAPERRGVPARRRRVRAAAARPRPARGALASPARSSSGSASSSSTLVGSVTVSAGIASFPEQALDRDELIRLADSALYWAKEHGRNRVHFYRPDVVELAELRRLAARPGPGRPLPRGGEPREGRRPARHVHRAATRAVSPTSPRGSPSASASTRSRSSSRASPAACTTSASSRSRRRSCASPAR